MESKYLVGYIHGQPAVMWDKIQDFEETVTEEGNVILKFKEDGVEYHYEGTPDRGYREVNNRAPAFQDYQYMGRRTALRHDFLNDQKRVDANQVDPRTLRPRTRHELDDGTDGDDDQFLRDHASGRRNPEPEDPYAGYRPVYTGPCGGLNSCGREPDYYEEIPGCSQTCGGLRRIYPHRFGCGYGGCGGGGHC